MQKLYSGSRGKRLSWARLALNNALQTPEILAALSTYGFNETQIQAGIALLEAAEAGQAAQKQAYGRQYNATQAFHTAWREANNERYTRHRQLARLPGVLDAEQLHALRLDEHKPQNIWEWLVQARTFYTNALADEDILSVLSRFQVTSEVLEDSLAQVNAVATLKEAQERAKSEAQVATQDQDTAFRLLDGWLSQFRRIARLALADDPQRLESLLLGAAPATTEDDTSEPLALAS